MYRSGVVGLVELARLNLASTALEALDYGAGAELYETMGARRDADRAARSRRSVGARGYVELDGIATLPPSDGARAFVTAVRVRTGDEHYPWPNTGGVKRVLDAVGRGVPRGRAHESRGTIA